MTSLSVFTFVYLNIIFGLQKADLGDDNHKSPGLALAIYYNTGSQTHGNQYNASKRVRFQMFIFYD